MKKIKQILAIIGIIFLLSLYLVTLFMAVSDDPNKMNMFYASIVATTIIPILMWAYSFIYKLIKGSRTEQDSKRRSPAEHPDEPEAPAPKDKS